MQYAIRRAAASLLAQPLGGGSLGRRLDHLNVRGLGTIRSQDFSWRIDGILSRFPRSHDLRTNRRAGPNAIAGTASLILLAYALYSPRLMLLGQANALNRIACLVRAAVYRCVLLAAFGIARACLKLTRFASVEWIPLVGIGINLAGSGAFSFPCSVPEVCWSLARVGIRFDLARHSQSPTRLVFWVLVGVCVLSALMCLEELRRYIRRRRNSDMLAV